MEVTLDVFLYLVRDVLAGFVHRGVKDWEVEKTEGGSLSQQKRSINPNIQPNVRFNVTSFTVSAQVPP